MRYSTSRLPIVMGLAAGISGAVMAASAPPIKPGLWQMHSEREVNGQKAPDPSEHMKNLPPEVRAKMQAMMKERGVDISGGAGVGSPKICLSKESLDQGAWQREQGGCQTTYSAQDKQLWKWHSVCSEPPSEVDGEARFTDPEHYTVETRMKMQGKGANQTMHMTIRAEWLGADCGDVAPVSPQHHPAKKRP